MLRQITQFDNDKTNVTVATPTCSCCSCCCCCCCLTTVISTSSLLGQSINRQAKKSNVENRIFVTALGVLLLPACIAFAVRFLTGNFVIWFIVSILLILIFTLFTIYSYVKFEKPLLKSIKTFSLIVLAVGFEFVVGAVLILFAWPLYIIFSIIALVMVQKIYSSKVKRKEAQANSVPSAISDPPIGLDSDDDN